MVTAGLGNRPRVSLRLFATAPPYTGVMSQHRRSKRVRIRMTER